MEFVRRNRFGLVAAILMLIGLERVLRGNEVAVVFIALGIGAISLWRKERDEVGVTAGD